MVICECAGHGIEGNGLALNEGEVERKAVPGEGTSAAAVGVRSAVLPGR